MISKIIIHFIDQATYIFAAARISNKNPEKIIAAILKYWIDIYGTATKSTQITTVVSLLMSHSYNCLNNTASLSAQQLHTHPGPMAPSSGII